MGAYLTRGLSAAGPPTPLSRHSTRRCAGESRAPRRPRRRTRSPRTGARSRPTSGMSPTIGSAIAAATRPAMSGAYGRCTAST